MSHYQSLHKKISIEKPYKFQVFKCKILNLVRNKKLPKKNSTNSILQKLVFNLIFK